MAIDPVNWRREMKKFIGAEISALKDENSNLREEINLLVESVRNVAVNQKFLLELPPPKNFSAELNALTVENSNLREEIKNLSDEVHALRNEISQIYAALNSKRLNIEHKPARKKIPVFGMDGAEINIFVDLAKRRNLPVDFVITDDVNYSADSAVFITHDTFNYEKYINRVKNIVRSHEKLLFVVNAPISRDAIELIKMNFNDSDWQKISIVYVDFRRNNFSEVENFFKEE